MNFQIEDWLNQFIQKCMSAFSDRLCLIGLQGSYGRGEATADSDIDMVVILDTLDTNDLNTYREIVASMPSSEKACGFCSGKQELLHWPRYDLFQLLHDTRVLYGSMDGIFPAIWPQDVQDAIRIGAANLYHAACHSYLYNKTPATSLSSLYKGTFFILQALHFYRTQQYISQKQELLPLLSGTDAEILALCINRHKTACFSPTETEAAYQKLISWCSGLLTFA